MPDTASTPSAAPLPDAPDSAAPRLRRMLLALAALVFAVTPADLLLIGHYGDWVQALPLALCGLGALAVGTLWLRPSRASVLAVRTVAWAIIAGSLFGIYEHVQTNLGFALEVNVGATVSEVFAEALAGVAPLLAPGVLAFGALAALIATVRHPALAA